MKIVCITRIDIVPIQIVCRILVRGNLLTRYDLEWTVWIPGFPYLRHTALIDPLDEELADSMWPLAKNSGGWYFTVTPCGRSRMIRILFKTSTHRIRIAMAAAMTQRLSEIPVIRGQIDEHFSSSATFSPCVHYGGQHRRDDDDKHG